MRINPKISESKEIIAKIGRLMMNEIREKSGIRVQFSLSYRLNRVEDFIECRPIFYYQDEEECQAIEKAIVASMMHRCGVLPEFEDAKSQTFVNPDTGRIKRYVGDAYVRRTVDHVPIEKMMKYLTKNDIMSIKLGIA